ncbi:MAG: hypothetical protein A3G34_13365 [Candidatus Lindowbacteria bacterium RIFCSPLOWO2_12_FULL_62_27]|nr:MAG: hypothetical protein A3G34_13365 [Candidatus Lindowbacteria bacterium RIFCSPLOWO2_12_FULL_62_27]
MDSTTRPAATRICAGACLLAFFLQSFTAMRSESDTWDEGLAIASDALRLFNGDWRVADYAPPLHTWLNAPALLCMKPRVPPYSPDAYNSESDYGYAFLYVHNDPDRILFYCRLSVLLSACLMGLCLYLWAARLGGPLAGAFAVFLMAFEPNLLTHSRVAAWDMLCTATVFIAAFAVWRWLEQPTWRRAFVAGLAAGLALISKYTALVMAPALAAGIVWFEWSKGARGGRKAISPSWLGQIGLGLLVAAAVVTVSQPGFNPMNYLRGAAQVYSVNVPPGLYQSYLLGRVFDRPVPYYYGLTFLMKTPLPLLLVLCLVLALRRRCSLAVHPLGFILAPVLCMFAAAAFDTYNVCNRRILPVYPFLILLASQLVRLEAPGKLKKFLIGAPALWLVVSAISVYPHPLSFFNEAAGGPAAGVRRLDECNVDWGQGLPRLSERLKELGIDEVRMPKEDVGAPERAAHYGLRHAIVTEEEYLSPKPAVYALSAHRVVWLKKQSVRLRDPRWDWLERFRPTAHVGYSIYIYDFRH